MGAENVEEPSPGELMVLKAIRANANTKDKIYKYFGIGATREQIDDFIASATTRNFIIESDERYVLTTSGLETILSYELEKPEMTMHPFATKEILLDKGVGGAIMALGIFFIYQGFQLAMEIYNNPPSLSTPTVESGGALGGAIEEVVGQTIMSTMGSMFEPFIVMGAKVGVAFLIIWVGGILLGRGIQLFRR
ncbi:MAG: hypothetical protein QMC77_01765 [Methanocellales archaeon]|nr:hypothetical protein [Methanocellales archaeon]